MSEQRMDGLSFIFGLILGACIVTLVAASPWSLVAKANRAIAQCEKDLPRSHICEVTAVPKGPHNE